MEARLVLGVLGRGGRVGVGRDVGAIGRLELLRQLGQHLLVERVSSRRTQDVADLGRGVHAKVGRDVGLLEHVSDFA